MSTIGSYEIVRRLGAGGMAEVYLALQHMASGVTRPVVLKTILPHLADDAKFVRMFLREARIAALLTHPNIVQIIDIQTVDGLPSIIMECLRGRDLSVVMRHLLKKGDRPSPEEAAAVVMHAALGLEHSHQARDENGQPLGLVHRDVSPQNLFLTRQGFVRVLDFGIAKIDDSHRTQQGALKGKIAYMAPEQARGLRVDARADQFALGVVLWELATGRRLFRCDDPMATLAALFTERVPPPSEVAQGVPPELDAIAMRLLERDAEDRFASCAEAAEALRELLRGARASDTALVAGMLERAVPAADDDGYYGIDESGHRTEIRLRKRDEDGDEDEEESEDDALPPGPLATATYFSHVRDAGPPPRRGARRAVLLGAAAVIAAGVGGALALAIPDDSPPPVLAVDALPVEPAPVIDSTSRLYVGGLPEGASLEVDGQRLEGTEAFVVSGAPHVVRVMRGSTSLWQWSGSTDAPELRLPFEPELFEPEPARAEPVASRRPAVRARIPAPAGTAPAPEAPETEPSEAPEAEPRDAPEAAPREAPRRRGRATTRDGLLELDPVYR